MVDNSTLPVASGTETFANDDISGVKYPRLKLTWGIPGASVDTSASNPLPITGTVTANVGAGTQPVSGTVSAIVSGTVAATQSGVWNIGSIATLPTVVVSGTVTANVGTGTQPVSGTVAATQSGTWNIAAITTLPALPAGTNNIGDVDVLTLPVAFNTGASSATTQRVVIASDQLDPSVAHDAADSGTPIKMGFKATTSLSGLTLVAAADRTDAFAGTDGVQIVRTHCNLEDIVTQTPATDTAGSSTTFISAQAAGIKTYLTSVIICNSSATGVTVSIRDGTTGKITLPVPATSGVVFNPPVPIPGTAATAWTFLSSAAATTITVSGIGFKSKV